MAEGLANLLDLRLAWDRVRGDLEDRVFVRHPYEVELIELDRNTWLAEQLEIVRLNRYAPAAMVVCDVPKAKGGIRPGALLTIGDRLIYAACVGACLEAIHATVRWSQGVVDFAYQLPRNVTDRKWLKSQFTGWQEFRQQSLNKVEEGYPYVVIADISSCYDNIDIATLISDLRQIDAPAAAVDQLRECLQRWALVHGRGIPQGQSASDILAKVYLNSIDHNLRAFGYEHYRYVDDFRIFCRDRVTAKKAIAELTRLLRQRGLTLQGTKSEMLRADEARERIEGVLPILNNVSRRFVRAVVRASGVGDPYMSIPEAERILIQTPDDVPLDLIREAYQTYFIDSDDSKFNPTLFRFLLNRLAASGDAFAQVHVMPLLERHPEETKVILNYLGGVEALPAIEGELIRYLESPDAIYPYQTYLVIEWLCEETENPSESLLALVRRLAFDGAQPGYLRASCRRFVGEFGSAADLERLEGAYRDAAGSLEQSEIICALSRMEKGRRNAFLARAERDGFLNMRAGVWVRRRQEEV